MREGRGTPVVRYQIIRSTINLVGFFFGGGDKLEQHVILY